MLLKYYSFGVVFLYICFNLSHGEVLTEDHNVVIDTIGSDENNGSSSQSEENIIKHLNLLISSLKNDINNKDKAIEQKLDRLETIVKHSFEDTVEEKFNTFEKKIEENIRVKYVSRNDIDNNVKRSIKESDKEESDQHNYNLNDLKRDIIGIKLLALDNSRKLESIVTTIANNSSILDIPKYSSPIEYTPIPDQINKLISTTTAIINQLNDTKNRENEFREIRWTDCKQETVINNLYYDYKRPLHPVADDTHRHVTYRINSNGYTEFFLLHVGIKANTGAGILLSQDSEPEGRVYHFRILIWRNETVLGSVENGKWNVLKTVQITTNLSNTQPLGVYIQIHNELIEVRREDDRVPILVFKDSRFKYVKYFGFSSLNNTYNATFLYDC